MTKSTSLFAKSNALEASHLYSSKSLFKLKINQQKQKPFLSKNYAGFDPVKRYVGNESKLIQAEIKSNSTSSHPHSSLK